MLEVLWRISEQGPGCHMEDSLRSAGPSMQLMVPYAHPRRQPANRRAFNESKGAGREAGIPGPHYAELVRRAR